MAEITLEQQIACVRREIAMRERVYPRWVLAKKMTVSKSNHELEAMRATLGTLESIAAKGRLL